MLSWFLPLLLSPSYAETVHMDEIHVLGAAERNSLLEQVPSSTRLESKELVRRREATLGETLKSEAGVNSSSFGPGASRPVIRGFDGDRVRVLQNGLGSLDASSQSVDHAIPVDPLNVEAVEVVRGPMALLYGASAVGGVVNIVNQRIHSQFEEGHLAQLESRTETAYGGMANAVRLDHGRAGWMFHLDGSLRDYGDQRIPGYARSARLRRTDPLPAGDPEPKRRLPNTQDAQRSASAGVSRVYGRGHVGLSFGHYSSEYGSVAEPAVGILMRQNRWELGAEHRPESAWVDKVRVRSAQSRYRHDEVEGGSVGTVFRNQGNETRLEALRARGNFSGVWGVQTQFSTFRALGEEAFLPTSRSGSVALFGFHQFKRAADTWSFGLRTEDAKVRRQGSSAFGETTDRGFTGLNASMGMSHEWKGGFSAGADVSYTERAPSFQELFAGGAHIATGSFERGDAGLGKEKALGVQANLAYKHARGSHKLGAFVQDVDHYIALSATGDTDGDSGFPEYSYHAVGARLHGAEAETRWRSDKRWTWVGKGDWLRGINTDDSTNLPRISPGRLSVGAEYERGRWSGDAEAQHVFMQTKTAPGETNTAGYTLLNLGVGWDWAGDETRLHLFARLKNLLDAQARQHLSLVKEIAPLPGRNLVAGLQAVF